MKPGRLVTVSEYLECYAVLAFSLCFTQLYPTALWSCEESHLIVLVVDSSDANSDRTVVDVHWTATTNTTAMRFHLNC